MISFFHSNICTKILNGCIDNWWSWLKNIDQIWFVREPCVGFAGSFLFGTKWFCSLIKFIALQKRTFYKSIKIALSVREITKSSSTFSATNISSNIVWSISTAWYIPNEIKWNSILVPNLVAFISQKEKNVWFFDYHSLTCSVRKMVLICLMQNIDMYLLYKSHQIARLVSHLINHFSKWMFTV